MFTIYFWNWGHSTVPLFFLNGYGTHPNLNNKFGDVLILTLHLILMDTSYRQRSKRIYTKEKRKKKKIVISLVFSQRSL